MTEHSEAFNNRIPEIPEHVTKDMVFERFNVKNMKELDLSVFDVHDQRLMINMAWDYENPTLVTNEIKDLLEKIEPQTLEEDDQEWRQNILWMWYHHAISAAIRKQNLELARDFADSAIKLHADYNPNKITKLLQLLVYDKVNEAKNWANTINKEPEKTTAQELVEEYEQGLWFKK